MFTYVLQGVVWSMQAIFLLWIIAYTDAETGAKVQVMNMFTAPLAVIVTGFVGT